MLTFLVIAAVAAQIVLTAFFAGVLEKHYPWLNGNDGPPAEVCGFFWPLSIVIAVVAGAAKAAYRLGQGKFRFLSALRALGRRRPDVIKIRNGKIASSAQYRKLASVMREYEKTLPVGERENLLHV